MLERGTATSNTNRSTRKPNSSFSLPRTHCNTSAANDVEKTLARASCTFQISLTESRVCIAVRWDRVIVGPTAVCFADRVARLVAEPTQIPKFFLPRFSVASNADLSCGRHSRTSA
jgi:hypothetical protein